MLAKAALASRPLNLVLPTVPGSRARPGHRGLGQLPGSICCRSLLRGHCLERPKLDARAGPNRGRISSDLSAFVPTWRCPAPTPLPTSTSLSPNSSTNRGGYIYGTRSRGPFIRTLIKAIKANLFAWYEYQGRSRTADHRVGPPLTWVLTPIHHPFMNNVLRTDSTPEAAERTISDTRVYFRSMDVTDVSWSVQPDSQPADLAERLVARGLTYYEGVPGMAADLLALHGRSARPPIWRSKRSQIRRAEPLIRLT